MGSRHTGGALRASPKGAGRGAGGLQRGSSDDPRGWRLSQNLGTAVEGEVARGALVWMGRPPRGGLWSQTPGLQPCPLHLLSPPLSEPLTLSVPQFPHL